MAVAAVAAACAGTARGQLVRIADSIVDPAALIMPSSATYGRAINGASFQVSAVQTFGGYQYTAWYTNDANASVMFARRTVSGTTVGPWDAVNTGSKFTNGKGSSNAHNVISFGIAGDGSIHMAWDMHNNNLRYRRTAAGLATTGSGWGASMFQAEQAFLMPGESTVTSVTYPNFVSKPNGGLLLAIRRGGSGNGDNWLYDYDAGQWHDGRLVTSRTGTFTDVFNPSSSPSTSRNAYWNGYDYGPDGTLHTTWTWRESTNQYANHDICYASSSDGGITWKNNAGGVIGDTAAARPITLDSPGQVIQAIDRKQSLINQQVQIVMGDGSVHAVMYHRRDDQPWVTGDAAYVPADCSYFDYVRDPLTGGWSRHELPGRVGTRAALARSADDTLYAVFVSPGSALGSINTANGASGQTLTIAAAHKAAGWSDWSIVHRDYLRNFVDEPRVDASRLLTSGVLSVYVQENSATTTTTGTPLRVIDFVPATAGAGDGWVRATGGSWTNAANWTPAAIPNSGTAQATIGYGFMGTSAITLDAAVTLNRLTYLGATSSLAAGTGGSLTFSGSDATAQIESGATIAAPVAGSFTKSGGGLLVLAADNTAGLGGRTVTVAGGQLVPGTGGTASGAEFGSATTTIVVQAGGQVWMTGLTAGSRTFGQTMRISGSGVGAGGYGAIVNDSGTANGIALAGHVVVEADATIAAINNASYTFGSGSTGFAEATAGRTLAISLAAGTSTLSGTVGVATLVKQGGGVLRLGAGNRVVDSGTVRVEAGTFDLGGVGERVATLTIAGGVVTSGTIQAAAYELRSGTLAAVVTGSGGIAKTGPGTATLAGSAVSYTGTTTVTAGVLAITSTTSLPGWNTAGRFAVSNGATLAVPASFSDATIATLVNTGNFSAGGRLGLTTTATTRTLSFGAGGQGGLGLMLNGSGTIAASGSNGYSGGTVLAGGLARVTTASGLGSGPITITGSAVRVVLAGSVALANDFVVDAPSGAVANGVIQYEGTGTGRLAGGTVTVLGSPASGGAFATTGGGTLVVEGPVNAPTRATVSMRIGTVVFAGGGSYATMFVNEGTARLGRNDGLATNATVTVGASAAATLDLAGFDQSLAGVLKGPGAATIGSSSTTRDATLTVTGSSTFGGVIGNTVGGGTRRTNLAVDGGWLRLSGSNTLTGTTTIRRGTLEVTTPRGLAASPIRLLSGGTLAASGTTGLAVAGLAVDGGRAELGGGQLTIAAGGMSQGDLVAALAAGRGAGSWTGPAGITSSAVAAAAATGVSRCLGWQENADGSLLVAPAAAGDANLDGLFDVLDASAVAAGGRYDTGLAATWTTGDFTYDGVVDILDISEAIATGLFDTGAYRTIPLAAVPEPGSSWAVLAACGTTALHRWRRMRRS
ncbi:MAG: BNR-4 repeat-containing protein [Planctomycetaceae bacterium]